MAVTFKRIWCFIAHGIRLGEYCVEKINVAPFGALYLMRCRRCNRTWLEHDDR